MAELGGRRHFPNIHNPSIKSDSFASYAEYMTTPEFVHGLLLLKQLARKCKMAIMCAEAVYWRCHHRMISDRLEFDNWQVFHLGILKKPIRHKIWDVARLDKANHIIYDKKIEK